MRQRSTASRVVVMMALLVAACAAPAGAPPGSPTDAPPAGSASSSPDATAPSSPSGRPASPPPSLAPMPVGGQLAEIAVRYRSCDVDCPVAMGVTVLRDGRVLRIPRDTPEVGVTERQLTPLGMQLIREALDATGLFTQDARFEATLNPGQQPGGFGPATLSFDVGTESGQVHVSTSEVGAFDADNTRGEIWTIPPESRVLEALGVQLGDLEAWLPLEAWAGAARPHVPAYYLLIVTAERTTVEPEPFHGAYPDADSVAWPFGGRIEAVGDPYTPPEGGDGASRCMVISRQQTEALAAAEAAPQDGRERDVSAWIHDLMYVWPRGHGGIQVTTRMILPYQVPACSAAGSW